jgi:hypothetical protein
MRTDTPMTLMEGSSHLKPYAQTLPSTERAERQAARERKKIRQQPRFFQHTDDPMLSLLGIAMAVWVLLRLLSG